MHPGRSSKAPSLLHIYDGTDASEVSVADLKRFLAGQVCSAVVDVREDFLSHWLGGAMAEEARLSVAARLARARVRQPERVADHEPLKGEIDYERRFLVAGGRKPAGILYDGHRLAGVYSSLLPPAEVGPQHCHVVLTRQLLGTWDAGDCRYHARAAVYGFPTLLSTTGLVAGPARPREFYLGRRIGLGTEGLQEALRGRYLEQGDPRLQQVLRGYLLQAVFYQATGSPFCEDKDCRLFNAHWQEEMIHAQTRPGADLCGHHRRILEGWRCR